MIILRNIDIKVKFDNDVPLCTLCNSSECAHSGFAIICAKKSSSLVFYHLCI